MTDELAPYVWHRNGSRCDNPPGCGHWHSQNPPTSPAPAPPRLFTPKDLENVTITASKVQPATITIPGQNGRTLITIRPDGTLEFADGYTPDEAARAFWEAVQRLTPDPMVREFGAPLASRINGELAAGQEAQRKLERIDSMAAAWLERLPDTISTATAVEAIHMVTREGST